MPGPPIHVAVTEDDVRSLANSAGVPFETAMERVSGWGRHIEEAAATLVNEQLENVIARDEP